MKKFIYRILMIICLCVFGYSAFQLYLIYQEANMIKTENKELEQHVVKAKYLEPNWDELKKLNEDIVGWLYMPGVGFSYPIVQGNDNVYYLNHTAKNENNYRGAIFMDYRANSDLSMDNTIIYGHSVEGGGMFTDLKKYANKEFFDNNLEFYILTPQANYRATIYTFEKTTESSSYYSLQIDDTILADMKNNAVFYNDIEVNENRLVTLSTCDLDYGFNSDQRLAISAVLEVELQPIEMSR